MELITYDHRNMLRPSVGLHGADADFGEKHSPQASAAKRTILAGWKSGAQGWLGCPDDKTLVKDVVALAKRKSSFDTCLVLGIGGSDLGARAGYEALRHTAKGGMKLVFAGGNTDPDELRDTLASLDWSRTLINIISKSGDTIEPMSAFLIAREILIKAVGQKRHAQHIVATTDAERGALRKMAKRFGYDTLPVPNNIGGRFSVLTAVGLFPLACAGIDIKAMLVGAGKIRTAFAKGKTAGDGASVFALHQYLADTERRQNIHVLMPYSSRLRELGQWYRQIWAESLGKKTNLAGDTIHAGPTPIAALGATDQHSQIQLYNEGPNNKTVTFIKVAKFDSALKVPESAGLVPGLKFLSGTKLQKIIHAELAGTAESLRSNKRPNGTLTIPEVSPEAVGALFMFFEIATAMAGYLYGINPYDQPGVEEGKAIARRLLGFAAG
jgi:glucose-6-phosphate isomerase